MSQASCLLSLRTTGGCVSRALHDGNSWKKTAFKELRMKAKLLSKSKQRNPQERVQTLSLFTSRPDNENHSLLSTARVPPHKKTIFFIFGNVLKGFKMTNKQ